MRQWSKKKIPVSLWLVLALFMLAGCVVHSVNPFYTRDLITDMPGLYGQWMLTKSTFREGTEKPWTFLNGTIMIPRQGRNHDPPKARSNAMGRAIQAKSRKNRENAAKAPVRQPELLGLVLVLIASPPKGCMPQGLTFDDRVQESASSFLTQLPKDLQGKPPTDPVWSLGSKSSPYPFRATHWWALPVPRPIGGARGVFGESCASRSPSFPPMSHPNPRADGGAGHAPCGSN